MQPIQKIYSYLNRKTQNKNFPQSVHVRRESATYSSLSPPTKTDKNSLQFILDFYCENVAQQSHFIGYTFILSKPYHSSVHILDHDPHYFFFNKMTLTTCILIF